MWLGFGVTAGFIALLVMRIDDFGDARDEFAQANYVLIAPAMAVYFVSFLFRAYRWQFLLRPLAPDIRLHRLYPVIMVGYMANNLLPARLGELVRGYYLSTREAVRGTTALATILTERVFDGLTLLVLLLGAAAFLPMRALLDFAAETVGLPQFIIVLIIVVPYTAALVAIALAARSSDGVRTVAEGLTRRLPRRITEVVLGLVDRFIAGFQGMDRPARLFGLLLYSLPVWLTEAAVYYIVALAFDLDAHFSSTLAMVAAMVLTLALSNLATSIPSSQGAVGPFEFFAVLALEGLGVDAALALAYVVVLHLTVLIPATVFGLVYLASQGLSLGQLTNRPGPPMAQANDGTS